MGIAHALDQDAGPESVPMPVPGWENGVFGIST
jgi:hypothetical protein